MYRSGITALNVQPDGSDTVRHKGLDDGRRNDLGITSTTVMRMYEDFPTPATLSLRDTTWDAGDRDYLAAGRMPRKQPLSSWKGANAIPPPSPIAYNRLIRHIGCVWTDTSPDSGENSCRIIYRYISCRSRYAYIPVAQSS